MDWLVQFHSPEYRADKEESRHKPTKTCKHISAAKRNNKNAVRSTCEHKEEEGDDGHVAEEQEAGDVMGRVHVLHVIMDAVQKHVPVGGTMRCTYDMMYKKRAASKNIDALRLTKQMIQTRRKSATTNGSARCTAESNTAQSKFLHK